MSNYLKIFEPKISVVICNYNYAKYVAKAIDSVINQTYKAYEIIVVDDGSTDDSLAQIKTYIENIKLIKKVNGGQISAYNKGFEHVSGDVVLFLDSDDLLLANALEEVSSTFKDGIVKTHFKMQMVDQDGNDLNQTLPHTLDSGDCSKALISNGLLYKSPPASGNAYRVAALKNIFPLPSSSFEKHGADFYCIYAVALFGNISRINKALFKYRIHSPKEDAKSSLSFGNALKNYDVSAVAFQRWHLFKGWVLEFSNGSIQLPNLFHDFSQQKLFFSIDALKAKSLTQKLAVARKHTKWIFSSILLRDDFNFFKKIALMGWAILVLFLPSNISQYLAKKVCNPS
jgi:glycosyltransferase involved in cell wall biosynthesis